MNKNYCNAGFHKACVVCPASFICITEWIRIICDDGVIVVVEPGSPFIYAPVFHIEGGLTNCPIARNYLAR